MPIATVTPTGTPTEAPDVASAPPAVAATAAPDTRRHLRDANITYAIRLAPAPDAEATMDALLTSFRSTYTCKQLLHTVQLLFDLQRDTGVFLMERITVARLTDQPSDDILDEVARFLQ